MKNINLHPSAMRWVLTAILLIAASSVLKPAHITPIVLALIAAALCSMVRSRPWLSWPIPVAYGFGLWVVDSQWHEILARVLPPVIITAIECAVLWLLYRLIFTRLRRWLEVQLARRQRIASVDGRASKTARGYGNIHGALGSHIAAASNLFGKSAAIGAEGERKSVQRLHQALGSRAEIYTSLRMFPYRQKAGDQRDLDIAIYDNSTGFIHTIDAKNYRVGWWKVISDHSIGLFNDAGELIEERRMSIVSTNERYIKDARFNKVSVWPVAYVCITAANGRDELLRFTNQQGSRMFIGSPEMIAHEILRVNRKAPKNRSVSMGYLRSKQLR